MRIYWSIPELKDLPTKTRDEVLRKVMWKPFRHWQTWAGYVALAVCVQVGISLGEYLGYPTIFMVLGAALGGFIASQPTSHYLSRYVREAKSGVQSS